MTKDDITDLMRQYVGDDLDDAVRQYRAIESKYFCEDRSRPVLYQEYEGAMLAPNGSPSNLNKEQWILVRTDAFKKWFGDWERDWWGQRTQGDNQQNQASRVVDLNGEPLVVFHGSEAEFTEFGSHYIALGSERGRFLGDGFYFSDKDSIARCYGPNVVASFLNIKNPVRLSSKFEDDIERLGLTGLAPKGCDKTLGEILSALNEVKSELVLRNISHSDASREGFFDARAEFKGKFYSIYNLTWNEVCTDNYVLNRFFTKVLMDEYGMPDINNLGPVGNAFSPHELTSALKANGFDGVIGDGADITAIGSMEYVVYAPDQIKLVADLVEANDDELSEGLQL